MTLSKAICTSLRKSRIILILLLIAPIYLSGATFNVAIVSENDSYRRLLDDVLDTFSTSVSSEYALDAMNARIDRDRYSEYASSFSKYMKAENLAAIESLSFTSSQEKSAALSVLYPEFSDIERKYLLSGDKEAFDYIKMRDGYDMLIALSDLSSDNIPEIAMYIDGNLEREALFIDSLKSVEEEYLFSLFSKLLLSDDYKAVSVDLPPSGTIYIDNAQTGIYTSRIILEKGEHDIAYIIPGYVSKEMRLIIDDCIDSIDLDLEEIPLSSLRISSIPYDSKIFYNGLELDGREIKRLSYPFTISARHSGFSLYSMQSMVPIDTLVLQLKPEWLEDEDMLTIAKSRFYMNLFSTLISFGGYVASNVVGNLLPDYDMKPVSVVLGGISLVSLVCMMDSMFEYFDSARAEI